MLIIKKVLVMMQAVGESLSDHSKALRTQTWKVSPCCHNTLAQIHLLSQCQCLPKSSSPQVGDNLPLLEATIDLD